MGCAFFMFFGSWKRGSVLRLVVNLMVAILINCFVMGKCGTTKMLLATNLTLLVVTNLLNRAILPTGIATANGLLASSLRCIGCVLRGHKNNLNVRVVLLYNFTSCVARVNTGGIIIGRFSGPLTFVGSPCTLLITTCVITYLVSLTMDSTANLNILLVTALFPVVATVNVSHPTTITIYTSPTTVVLSPASNSIVITTRGSNVPLRDFTIRAMLPISVYTVVIVTTTTFF